MKIAVVVATLGRPEEAADLAADLAGQTRPPDEMLFCVVDSADAPQAVGGAEFRKILCSHKGSCAQRNMGISAAIATSDVVLFMDDDFVPAPDYIENLEAFFQTHSDAAGVTGLVLADGITGPGLSREEAVSVATDSAGMRALSPVVRRRRGLYGCNMAVRTAALGDLRFDENLPLYGWLEDLDLSTRLARRGALYQANALRGVHRGVKRARTSGVRFGYSQIANPVYLLLRGRVPAHYAAANIFRNLAANTLRAARPEPWVDRRGRLRGNGLAFRDMFTGRLRPDRILDL